MKWESFDGVKPYGVKLNNGQYIIRQALSLAHFIERLSEDDIQIGQKDFLMEPVKEVK